MSGMGAICLAVFLYRLDMKRLERTDWKLPNEEQLRAILSDARLSKFLKRFRTEIYERRNLITNEVRSKIHGILLGHKHDYSDYQLATAAFIIAPIINEIVEDLQKRYPLKVRRHKEVALYNTFRVLGLPIPQELLKGKYANGRPSIRRPSGLNLSPEQKQAAGAMRDNLAVVLDHLRKAIELGAHVPRTKRALSNLHKASKLVSKVAHFISKYAPDASSGYSLLESELTDLLGQSASAILKSLKPEVEEETPAKE